MPASAVCVALIATACGGSGRHAPTRTVAPTQSPTATAQTRPSPPPPSPAQIESAATLTAAKPGFRARLDARVRLPQLGGNALTAVGRGHFDPASSSGTLEVAVGLPGLLGLVGPLPTQVRLVGSRAYVRVPPDVAGRLPTRDAWLQEGIDALGLGDSLRPSEILREVARDATRTVPGQRAHVTIDPSTGLVRTIVLDYTVRGGYRVHVRLVLTGFRAEPATAAPPPGRTADLRTALAALGF